MLNPAVHVSQLVVSPQHKHFIWILDLRSRGGSRCDRGKARGQRGGEREPAAYFLPAEAINGPTTTSGEQVPPLARRLCSELASQQTLLQKGGGRG